MPARPSVTTEKPLPLLARYTRTEAIHILFIYIYHTGIWIITTTTTTTTLGGMRV